MTMVLLAARFALELALLAALAVVGWRLPDATWAQVLLALVLPAAAAVVWGLLVSPKARFATLLPVRLVVEVGLFATASALLMTTGSTVAAAVLIASEVVVLGALISVGSPPGPSSVGAG